MGLQESVTTQAHNKVMRENGWYWLAAVPRTVTSGERSIWTFFYYSKMAAICDCVVDLSSQSILLSNLVLGWQFYRHDSQ